MPLKDSDSVGKIILREHGGIYYDAFNPAFIEDDISGIPKLIQGTSATPYVLNANPGALLKAREVAITHSAGAGDCGDLLGDYVKVNVLGDGDAGMTPVAQAKRLYIGATTGTTVAGECYADQTWLYKKGTGTVDTLCGQSIVVNVGADNFTASSRVQGLNVTLDGSATITTGLVRGIVIDIKSGRTAATGIQVNCQTTTTNGLQITGAPGAEILLSSNVGIFTGIGATRAAVQALTAPGAAAIGSVFIGTGNTATTKPNVYIKVTANTWERVVMQAAD